MHKKTQHTSPKHIFMKQKADLKVADLIEVGTIPTTDKVVYLGFGKAFGVGDNDGLGPMPLLVFSSLQPPYPHTQI